MTNDTNAHDIWVPNDEDIYKMLLNTEPELIWELSIKFVRA